MTGLLDKVVVVTGAAKGSGRVHCARFADEGADVIALDAPAAADELRDTARKVADRGRRCATGLADVSDLGAVTAAIDAGVAELGRLDVVVANAGICSAAMSWEIPVEKWRETIDTNLTGTFFTVKATIPTLIEQGTGGSIIITSSVAGLRGLPFLADYAASKHGVTGLAKTLANELAQFSIRVNTIHPHGVATGMQPAEMFELTQQYAATLGPIFMGSLPDPVSQPEDIAAAVAFLASDESRHVTGIQFPVDLGTLAR
jgi:SDR family mycofactocin-dependent oxidoreductase